ncbi:YdeI/OmpD-associated family protein [Mycolicibacterium hodleri]|uniref:DUF1905 domain-containing protein n=1 Tax=Mycolicibacterium hodleri TaxID=49897 RepID=A0A502E378_9MYCO|nr:YdeI/OmpD-associated family protein [Mycolicibacterium hodleri]TPG31977.1 DUF1905 domain-containing protein [Mycolicibacterium hodleri]
MRFSTTMVQTGNNTGIEVPSDVIEALGGGKRAPVVVTVNGYRYSSTVASMGGKFMVPFSAERRRESGVGGGDAIDVELVLDTAPRTVSLPADLQASLDASTVAAAAWQKLAPSQQKAHVAAVLGAKAADTRARRIAAIVAKLEG